ncbi:hypothetical protein CPC08DRAFT_710455 [Agrocybe pediades]|nr:hypothetical protein CPC08DRAFT_710455 [Agrocybe pediades]
MSPAWSLTNIQDCEDPLGILNVVTELEDGINQHHEQLALYLRNPKRSGRFSLQEAGGLLHANAVLACLAFISRVKVEEKEVIAAPESSTETWVTECDIRAADGVVVDEDGKKVEENFKGVLEEYYGEEKRFIVFPNMCAWRWDWERFRKEKGKKHLCYRNRFHHAKPLRRTHTQREVPPSTRNSPLLPLPRWEIG